MLSIRDRFRTHRDHLREQIGSRVITGFFEGLAALGRLHPQSKPGVHGIELIADVPYKASPLPEHRLDIYRPINKPGPWPVVLYIHGGSFRILSKDSHWIMALAFARRGYIVMVPNYRLSPASKFPAALEDACAAYAWTVRHAAEFGGDPTRLVIAGESAGANLTTAVTLATSFRRPEPWAREVYDLGVQPKAVAPACGILQVSDAERFARRKNLPAFVQDRLRELSDSYLGGTHPHEPGFTDLADPLVYLEEGPEPDRPLPPFFVSCGTKDVILDDSRRLAAALEKRGVPNELQIYVGEPHAFHAFVWRPKARLCWQDHFRFLDTHV